MTNVEELSKKIFDLDKNIRGYTIGRFDGEILKFEMRPGIVSLNPPGNIGKLDTEVLVPTLSSYFERHEKYFGNFEYITIKFEKVSLLHIRFKNLILVISVEPFTSVEAVAQKIKKLLLES